MYVVKVDENGRHMDEDARWTLGQFETFDEAEAACRRLVNDCLAEAFEPGMTMAALVTAYRMFGDDPFIVTEADMPSAIFGLGVRSTSRGGDVRDLKPSHL